MKVKIEYTVSITPEQRLALGHSNDKDGPASREDVQQVFENLGREKGMEHIDETVREYYLVMAKRYAAMAEGDAKPEPDFDEPVGKDWLGELADED